MIKIAAMLALWLMLQGCKPVNQDAPEYPYRWADCKEGCYV